MPEQLRHGMLMGCLQLIRVNEMRIFLWIFAMNGIESLYSKYLYHKGARLTHGFGCLMIKEILRSGAVIGDCKGKMNVLIKNFGRSYWV